VFRRVLFLLLFGVGPVIAQAPPAYPAGTLPLINVGGNYMESQFAQVDFAQMLLQNQQRRAKDIANDNAKLIASGLVSALDLQAPEVAVREFNAAADLLKGQKSKEAIPHLQKALRYYPRFVSAHQDLGVAYEDLDDRAGAQTEFETAAGLDPKFAAPLLHLGRLDLSANNVEGARDAFEKAAALRPRDPQTLMLLCYAQNRSQDHQHAIETADRVHALDHKGLANVHYVAASSAISLRDYAVAERELKAFVDEDPSNPLAPASRKNLEILARNRTAVSRNGAPANGAVVAPVENLANTERLRGQLAALGSENDDESPADTAAEPEALATASSDTPAASTGGFTFRRSVDEVAVFFSASSHGRSVTDLEPSDIKILDANRPPEKLIQFTPQSRLPLHLALLIDTSGSVKERFSFEKNAAARFLEKTLRNASDMAFIAGFSSETNVTQDFTADRKQLAAGLQKLDNKGGTALFDAVSFACWKLAVYPQRERVANVLVVLTDGEDNSSRTSLKQAIRNAEATGVTVYAISTNSHEGPKSDADKILLELAERSGGSATFPDSLMALNRIFDKLQDAIRSRYLVAYKPADFVPNGAYRPISIAAAQNGERLQVHARKGYHARLASPPVSR
jgi:Ca-activated chloride channel homolog